MGQAKQKDLRIQELQEENRILKASLTIMDGECVYLGEAKNIAGVLVRDISIRVPVPAGWHVPPQAQPHYDQYTKTISIRLNNHG
jgi:hypothetical protein